MFFLRSLKASTDAWVLISCFVDRVGCSNFGSRKAEVVQACNACVVMFGRVEVGVGEGEG